jgi:predicted permease
MIWILLFYVLPLILCIVGGYWMVKKNEGTIKDFLEPLPFCFIPIATPNAIDNVPPTIADE